MDEKKQLFRQSSLDRISSPDDLNDYVRVANPGVWMIMGAVIVFLIGLCVWAFVGEMTTSVGTVGVSENGKTVFYVSEERIQEIGPGMRIVCDDETEFTVASVSDEPAAASSVLSEYALHLGGFEEGDWVCAVNADGAAEEGAFRANIILTSVKPISFILN